MGNIVYPLIIWKIWIIQSTSSYFLSSHYACFGTGEGFTLDTIYEIWQRQFNKVIEFRFKSCFLHYWLSTSGVSNLSTPQFPHLQKGDDTLVLLWLCLYNTDLGYWTLQSALQWLFAGFFLTLVHMALCTFILSYTQLRPSNYTFLGRCSSSKALFYLF